MERRVPDSIAISQQFCCRRGYQDPTARVSASREETMKKTVWVVLLALALAACGGDATTSTLGTADEAGNLRLAGLTLDVHQAPD